MTKIERGSSPLTRGKPHRGVPDRAGTGLIPAHAGKTIGARESPITRWAHPRSRGENAAGQARRQPGKGSSPLTRGKLLYPLFDLLVTGLIPAHAGKTTRSSLIWNLLPAHPRSRGENWACFCPGFGTYGSSPLTRGKPAAMDSHRPERGLIPAHAGKTWGWPIRKTRARAHPRSRGENTVAACPAFVGVGSSPLTRGKRAQ